jgi:uncharacterized repeat protein (TIGR04076 family)
LNFEHVTQVYRMADDNEFNEWAESVIQGENRFCQKAVVTHVSGTCPFGHCEGDTFNLTALHAGGMCGALLTAVMPSVVALHYGGSLVWENRKDAFTGCCPEGGRVTIDVQRQENTSQQLLKEQFPFRDMTGKGYPALDAFRVFVEVEHIEGNCLWGHAVGDRIEIDPFNTNGMCCLLYNQLYPYLHVLLSGETPPWATREHSIAGECPDTFNRLCFRLSVEPRC